MERINYMLGDWARIKISEKVGFVTRQVRAPDLANYHDRKIEPIPLTDEILRKNGFQYFHKNIASLAYDSTFMLCMEEWPDEEGIATWSVGGANIIYVHELQHALRLYRVNKEIIL